MVGGSVRVPVVGVAVCFKHRLFDLIQSLLQREKSIISQYQMCGTSRYQVLECMQFQTGLLMPLNCAETQPYTQSTGG